jgi:hypothetical protein
MTSIIKVNNLQNQCGANTINKCGTAITVGASGDTVTLAAGASQSGFGQTYSAVSWDTTPKTTTVTGVAGVGYFVNTSGGAITANLPAGTAGDVIALADYAATWQTNNVTVTPNGTDKIGSVNADAVLSTEGQSVTFVYVDSTQGWINTMDSTSNVRAEAFISATGGTETTCGNCKIHTFTGPGTFTVNNVATCILNNVISHLVVAGGGGGGACGGGGGGAGGFREVKSPVTPYTASPLDGYPSAPNRVTVTATSFPITVGAAGAGAAKPAGIGSTGSNSVFSTITSAGGGGGGQFNAPSSAGLPGGSGGGSGGIAPSTIIAGGPGNQPPVSPSQGNNGGTGQHLGGCSMRSGGGGGATTVGGNGANQTPGPGSSVGGTGGTGTTTSITGSPLAYAGGGGGSGFENATGCGTSPCGTGGTGQGRAAAASSGGTTNRGGGGGGGAHPGGGVNGGSAGGSGIVIIRYKFQ